MPSKVANEKNKKMKRYPSITALRAFESIARLGSVSAAARELNLTRSAISHQLTVLEETLHFPLTERIGRGIGLTLQGERYATEAKRVLTILNEAAHWNEGNEVSGRLSVSCAPGLANYWLCHHLGDFTRQFPKLTLHISAPEIPHETTKENVDIFIAYGNGTWPDKYVRQLITIRLFPVCSPSFSHRMGGLSNPSRLLKLPLLHLVSHTDWRVWLAANGVNDLQIEGGIIFSDANFVQSAAMAGQGIAIGDNMVSGDALAQGLLIRPFEISIESPRAYYLVADPEKLERPEVQAFIKWLENRVADAQERYHSATFGQSIIPPKQNFSF